MILKLLFIEFNSFSSGGTERMSGYIMNSLIQHGFDIYLASILSKGNPSFAFHKDKQITFIDLSAESKANHISRKKCLHEFILKNDIDIIVCVTHYVCLFAKSVVRKTNAKIILWEHFNVNYRLHKFKIHNIFFTKFFRRKAIKGIDKIVVLTEQDKKNYQNILQAKQEITVIPNITFKQNYNYNIESKQIISVGWLRYVKGYDLAIKIAANVLPKHPDWKWIVYGKEESPRYYKYLKHLVKEFGLGNQFILAGSTSDIEQKYKDSSFCVMTSRYEGLPMVLLEAKSYGLPIVSFDIKTGPNEIIRDGINGYLVEYADIDTMSEKIECLIKHPEIRQELSGNSQLDMEKFDYDNIVSKWCDLLQR